VDRTCDPHSCRSGSWTDSGVVSIAEVQSVYGPLVQQQQSGGWGLLGPGSSGFVRRSRPLTITEKGLLLAGLTLLVPHVALATRTYAGGATALRYALKLGIPYAFGVGFDWTRPIQPDMDFRFTFVPRGGGPGTSPISTNPPLSLEATGASLTQPGKPGGPARSSKRGGRPRRKCKPGYRWNGHRCVRKDW